MGTSKSNSEATASKSRLAIAICAFVFVTYLGFELWSAYSDARQAERQKLEAQQKSEAIVEALVDSEELLLELTPLLRTLSRSAENLQLPDRFSVDIFAEEVAVNGVPEKESSSSGSGWSIAKENALVNKSSLSLWAPIFSSVAWIEQAKFFFINGDLDSHSSSKFRTRIGFKGILKLGDGQVESIEAKLKVDWEKVGIGSDTRWVISRWQLAELKSLSSPKKLFKNVLSSVLEDRETYVRATFSKHTALTSHLMRGKEYNFPPGETYPLFFPDVTLEHPGVSVVDIDNDGLEDFYVAMQHDANLLFRNRGDGTFEEVASRYGLDIRGDSTSAIFADFDNDGDQDLFLGRARRKSMYLVNDGGMFFDRTAQCVESGHLPALVSSVSATDYNNDGLLDIYLCTYSPIEESNRFHVANKPMWIGLFLNEAEGDEVMRRNRNSHRFIDRAGPPNVLLRNLGGGKFAVAKENAQLQLWRMSFQAAWNDFDNDGDQDVYVANDYAPDNFFRNDGPSGFTDVTEEVGITGMGFGMGISWGDYDNDGQTDAFVTNMYSKAGRRITERISGVDPRIREMAEGNFLYRLNEGKFTLASGEGGLKVAKSGWSWGGQFFDFDNDGYRDIYATSGYYTAPADVAEETDL